MTTLREAAQQALEALETGGWNMTTRAIASLRAALAQPAEPDHETRAELAEQQVVQLAEERDHYRNLWQKAQQAEPVEPPKASAAGHGMAWPGLASSGLASSGLARFSQTGNGGQR